MIKEDVEDGNLFWVPPDTLNEMRGYPPEMHCIYLHFDLCYDPRRSHWDACIPGGSIDLGCFTELMHPPVNDPIIGKWKGKIIRKCPECVGDLITEIVIEHKRARSFHSPFLLSSMMRMLIFHLIDYYDDKPECKEPFFDRIRDAARNLSMSTDGKLDIRKHAAAAGLSVPHFRRIFRRINGTSPGAVHRKAKIQKACEMLVYTSKNISEIAGELGFSNIHNFSRAFRNSTGVSPRTYRSK